MASPDILAQVTCEGFPHPSHCNVCTTIIAVADSNHAHFQYVTKDGFKPFSMHALCARAYKAGTAAPKDL